MFKPTIFREYDIRGTADEELLDADVESWAGPSALTCSGIRASESTWAATAA